MKEIILKVNQDHLERLSNERPPVDAMAEPIRDSLDADATEADVAITENGRGGAGGARVKDNCNGVTAEDVTMALAGATHLVFIGYSFPESDAYMRYFLGASLAENVALEAIHIIDPKTDAIVGRLRDGGHYGEHFLDMLNAYNRYWHLN